jgi:uncharacterized Tic20 family protein
VGSVATVNARVGAFFPTLFTITELTEPLVNIIWFLERFGYKEGRIYTVMLFVRVVLFVVLRAFIGPFTVWYALKNYDRNLPQDKHGRVWLGWKQESVLLWKQFRRVLPWWVQLGTVVNVSTFVVLNLGWNVALIKLFMRHLRKESIVAAVLDTAVQADYSELN